jgi:hypothetical protein
MKERQARIVGYEVNFGRLVARNVDYILEDTRCTPFCNLDQFNQGVPRIGNAVGFAPPKQITSQHSALRRLHSAAQEIRAPSGSGERGAGMMFGGIDVDGVPFVLVEPGRLGALAASLRTRVDRLSQ